MKIKKYLWLFAIFLSACVSSPDPLFSDAEIKKQGMSHLIAVNNEYTAEGFESSILFVSDENQKVIIEPKYLKSFYKEVYLPAGRYSIQLMCQRGSEQSTPILVASIESLKQYDLTCEAAETKTNKHGHQYIEEMKVNIQKIESNSN